MLETTRCQSDLVELSRYESKESASIEACIGVPGPGGQGVRPGLLCTDSRPNRMEDSGGNHCCSQDATSYNQALGRNEIDVSRQNINSIS